MAPDHVELTGSALPPDFLNLDPPCRRLLVRGRLPEPHRPRVAVVGSRTPSRGGRQTAYELSYELAKAGLVIVSGMARGIDSAAHRGALDAGGRTVAFLGSGIDVVYPRSSRDLVPAILEAGAVISEYPPGAPPMPYRFVHRNRLVAAYTRGTLVVEAGAKSGALITAGLSLAMNRELWAVPGDPHRPTTRGSNRLVRDGAGVILEAADLLAALDLQAAGGGGGSPGLPPGLSPAEERVLGCLRERGPSDPETLSRRTGLTAAALLEALSLLELAGHVDRDGDAVCAASFRKPGF
jgi:DNA processing protein